jgi:hypothetical protein
MCCGIIGNIGHFIPIEFFKSLPPACRYFTCKPLHGLFSPIQCVSRLTGTTTPRRASAASRLPSSSLRRSNSRESLGGQSVTSSVGASSVASSIARPTFRVRLWARYSSFCSQQTSDVEKTVIKRNKRVHQRFFQTLIDTADVRARSK